jgi:Kdo2-lipid IVA lauroyltransferase/acyltransferase
MVERVAVGLLWVLHFLPLRVLALVGEAFGVALYALAHERRRVCTINLEKCFPHWTSEQRAAVARAHFRAQGRAIVERSLLWWAPRERIMRLARIAGLEHLRPELGKPLIVLVPHFVGLDAGGTRIACEYDWSAIYAKQKSSLMTEMLVWGRSRFGNQRLYSRQDGVRAAVGSLRKGIPLYYLPDQDYGPRDAIFVPFFGVPAATITGLSRLAALGRARVIPCITRLLPQGRGYEVRFYPAWDNFPTADVAADARRMNTFIEERVLEMPEQYNWAHKRFKTRPEGEDKWY